MFGRPGWPANGRPIFYGLAAWPFDLQTTLWPVVLVQALTVAWTINLTLRCFRIPVGRRGFLAIIALLTGATPLSWYVSYIMPDVFSGILILGMVLLACCGDRLGSMERMAVALLSILSITLHVTHLVIALAILLQAILLWTIWRRARCFLRPLVLVFVVLAGLGGLMIYPWVVRHDLALAPNSLPWPLARVIVDGPGIAYLHAACPTRHYVLCDHLNDLPHRTTEDFLWSPNSPVQSPEFREIRREAVAIVIGTIRMYPGWMAQLAADHFLEQLVTVGSSTYFSSVDRAKMAVAFPAALHGYQRSAQARGYLDDRHLRILNSLYGVIYGIATAVSAALVVPLYRRSGERLAVALGLIVAAAMANAFACAVFSGVYGRYQGRISWLPALWAIMATLVLWRGAHRSSQPVVPELGLSTPTAATITPNPGTAAHR